MDDSPQDQSRIQKFAHTMLVSVPCAVIGILLVAMVTINLANVTARHVFGQAVFWAEEIMKLCLVWGVFLGAVAVTFRRDHLCMDLLSEGFRKPFSTILNVISAVTLIAVASYVAYYSYQVAQIMSATGRVSDAAQYPIVVQHLAVFISMVLMVVAVIVSWRAYMAGRAKE